MPDPIKRVNFFDRQFLRAKEFQEEQAYQINRRRRHTQLLHTSGVAGEGLQVSGTAGSNVVTVSSGMAIDPEGKEIVLDEPRPVTMPTGQASVELFIEYKEEASDARTESGITGFTRITERPSFIVAPPGAATPNAVKLARIPLNAANGQVNGPIDNSVRSGAGTAIGNLTITTDKLANLAVTSAKLANNAVTTIKLQSDAANNVNRAVGTNHIQDNAVTAAKLQSDAATDANRAVTANHIKDNAVTAAKLQSDAATDANRAVGTNHIKDDAITQAKVAPNAISIKELKGTVVEGTVEITGGKEEIIPSPPLLAGFYIPNFAISSGTGTITVQEELVNLILSFPPIRREVGRRWRLKNPGPANTSITVAFHIYKIDES